MDEGRPAAVRMHNMCWKLILSMPPFRSVVIMRVPSQTQGKSHPARNRHHGGNTHRRRWQRRGGGGIPADRRERRTHVVGSGGAGGVPAPERRGVVEFSAVRPVPPCAVSSSCSLSSSLERSRRASRSPGAAPRGWVLRRRPWRPRSAASEASRGSPTHAHISRATPSASLSPTCAYAYNGRRNCNQDIDITRTRTQSNVRPTR